MPPVTDVNYNFMSNKRITVMDNVYVCPICKMLCTEQECCALNKSVVH